MAAILSAAATGHPVGISIPLGSAPKRSPPCPGPTSSPLWRHRVLPLDRPERIWTTQPFARIGVVYAAMVAFSPASYPNCQPCSPAFVPAPKERPAPARHGHEGEERGGEPAGAHQRRKAGGEHGHGLHSRRHPKLPRQPQDKADKSRQGGPLAEQPARCTPFVARRLPRQGACQRGGRRTACN